MDTMIYTYGMNNQSLYSAAEVQQELAQWMRAMRRKQKLSRAALAERSTVPAPTLKRFEATGQISLRQFLLLWQSLDDLRELRRITVRRPPPPPRTIEEVLRDA